MASEPKADPTAGDAASVTSPRGTSADPFSDEGSRPSTARHTSGGSYRSPSRHHRRKQSSAKEVKETLHAHSEYSNSGDDGSAIHRINQYVIKEEIGRGSFGAVHLAVDQNGVEYAVKEFSKSRLRKRAQSNILRRPHAAKGWNRPPSELITLHRQSSAEIQDQEEGGNPLYLIKEEIAIMKKLDHMNLVSLIEVLDDPNEDSLYMVQEICKKGVIMKVGVDEGADPYDDESCRCWFRDLILGIEYLHAQGVVHRDIKPDNLLLTADDILKIVDFGVSEIFEKKSEMLTAKSAGSPAFLPPELCVAKHGDISGKAADIWSMGVTLYCLRFGRIPFERTSVLELYESIRNDELHFDPEIQVVDPFKDLIVKVLQKDPAKRIKMTELRQHPWVTKDGTDPLLSEEENTSVLVEPPTEEETDQAITGSLGNVMQLVKNVKRFKDSIGLKKHATAGILGGDAPFSRPPASMAALPVSSFISKTKSEPVQSPHAFSQQSKETDDDPAHSSKSASRHNTTNALGENDPSSPTSSKRDLDAHPEDHRSARPTLTSRASDHLGKGQAHDPLSEHLYLALGNADTSGAPSPPCVSESPPAAESNIYESAYDKEIQRLRSEHGRSTTLFLTRRVENRDKFRLDEDLVRGNNDSAPKQEGGLAKLFGQVKAQKQQPGQASEDQEKPEDAQKSEAKASSAPKLDAAAILHKAFGK